MRDLYLLVGQSNMAGRGAVEAMDKLAHGRVEFLDRWAAWKPAVDPLHDDKPDLVGVGPGKTFGAAMAQASPGAHIGLVPCAVGGSSIACWEPGAAHPETGTHPFDDMLSRVQAASPAGTWRGVLWHQGEADANPQDAPAYEPRLRSLIQRIRAVLNSADLPFAIGQLGQWPDAAPNLWWKHIDDVHRAVAASTPSVVFVGADGLAHKGDRLHFDASSARELGRRYARAMLHLQALTA